METLRGTTVYVAARDFISWIAHVGPWGALGSLGASRGSFVAGALGPRALVGPLLWEFLRSLIFVFVYFSRIQMGDPWAPDLFLNTFNQGTLNCKCLSQSVHQGISQPADQSMGNSGMQSVNCMCGTSAAPLPSRSGQRFRSESLLQ